MQKRGYIKISDVYQMDWRDAQPFWRGDPTQRQVSRLDPASLQVLLAATFRVAVCRFQDQYDPSSASTLPRQPLRAPAASRPQYVPTAGNRQTPAVIPATFQSVPARARPLDAAPGFRNNVAARPATNDERRPLLPTNHTPPSHGPNGSGRAFFGWLWDMLKLTGLGIIGLFSVVQRALNLLIR